MTNCKRFENLLALRVENDLTPEESAAVERHLADCPDCREEFEALVESQALFRSAGTGVAPEDIVRDVRRRVLARIEENPEAVLGWRIRAERAILAGVRRPVTVAAACGAVILIAVLLVPSPVPETPDTPEVVAAVPETIPETITPDEPTTGSMEEEVDPEIAEAVVVVRDDEAATPASQPSIPATIDWEPLPVESDIPPQRTVKLVTDDPQVIIYWVLEESNEGGGA